MCSQCPHSLLQLDVSTAAKSCVWQCVGEEDAEMSQAFGIEGRLRLACLWLRASLLSVRVVYMQLRGAGAAHRGAWVAADACCPQPGHACGQGDHHLLNH